ncbi:MAG TPA: tripartite tricarboxylate transporter substrate binding protein [Burkholderiales bacterium]|nr:tripartite tricarboxylate transporter substrate binding protein [Burkholderiales bacterium]
MTRIRLCSALAALLASTIAMAQQYPTKPVRLIVPFAPGGPADITARIVGQKLTEALGQQFVVENRAGATGTIGAEHVARSAPDGYTVLVTASANVIVPHMFSKLAFDPLRDFTPVTVVLTSPLLLTVTRSLPAKSVKEIVALARARPNELSFGSSGPGSSTHLTAELLKSVTGTKMTHVPYKGQGQAIADVIAGQIQLMFLSPPAAKQYVDAGRLRALAITSGQRFPQLPNVPTFIESGYKELITGSWYAVWVPAKTPEAIVSRLNSELVRIVNMPDVRNRIVELGGVPVGNSVTEFDAFQKAESARWAKIIRESGAKLE